MRTEPPPRLVRCGKLRYPDRFEAESALANTKRVARRNPARRERRAYHCDVCHGWHLTSAESFNSQAQ